MTYTNYFGGNLIQPADVAYSSITFTAVDEVVQLAWPSTYLSSVSTQAVYTQILNVNAAETGCVLQLPDQTQVSVGQTILIQNSGIEEFTVIPFYGTQVVVIAPGEYYFLWLYDNTNTLGIPHWGSVQYGSTVTQANAADLAGKGLLAQGLTLNRNRQTTISAGSYNLQPNDRDTFFVYQGGLGTFTLPNAGTVGNGWQVSMNNNSSTGGILTVNPQAGQFIDSTTSYEIYPNESITFITDGSNWYSLGYSQIENFSYGINNLVLSSLGATYTLSGAQAQSTIQQYSGVLTQNITIYFPPTAYSWYVTNSTTGAYTVSLQLINGVTPIGNLITIPQGESLIVYSNETTLNIIPSVSSSSFPLLAPNGSVAVPSYSFSGSTNTGMYYDSTASGQLAFSLGGNKLFYINAVDESINVTNDLNVGGTASISTNLLVSDNTTLSGTLAVTGTSTLTGAVTLGSQLVLASTTPLNQRLVFGTTPSISLGSVADGSSIQFQTLAGPYTPLMNINASNVTFSVPAVFSAGQSSASFQATAQGSSTAPAFGLSGQQTGVYFPTTTSVSFTAGGTQTFASSTTANTFYKPIAISGAGVNTTSFNNLSPCTAAGDMIAYNGTNNVRVPASTTANEVLLSTVAGIPVWGGYSVLGYQSYTFSTPQTIALSGADQDTNITFNYTKKSATSRLLIFLNIQSCTDHGGNAYPNNSFASLSLKKNGTVVQGIGLTGSWINSNTAGTGSLSNLLTRTLTDSTGSTGVVTYTVSVTGLSGPTFGNAYFNQLETGISSVVASNATIIELGGF